MSEDQNQIAELTEKLRFLMQRHQDFSKEIQQLRDQIYLLRDANFVPSPKSVRVEQAEKTAHLQPRAVETPKIKLPSEPAKARSQTDFEKFLGENLINKIGILITIIGVVIGAKYSIDNGLISPLTRIVLGYLCGAGLLGFGLKLKENYEKFSAVLVSGAMCILYFLTFAAHDFYHLIPQLFAFGLMLVFTAFTVFAAINYKRQIIAHIGLVGAYAVPFLLSNHSGNVAGLFIYMLIINIGILIVSFKHYWKSLYYVAFAATWIIFAAWVFDGYDYKTHFAMAFLFLIAFFLVFYATFLAYKVLRKEQFEVSDIILLLFNSFIFFGFGLDLLQSQDFAHLLGAFTLANGAVHALVSGTLYKLKLVDAKLLYLIAGLVMVFITIAVPIQFDGNWVTLIWIAQAVLLFVLAKTKSIPLYQKMAYPILALASISLLIDWCSQAPCFYEGSTAAQFVPFLNINYGSTIFYLIGLSIFIYLQQTYKAENVFEGNLKSVTDALIYLLPALGLILLYLSNYLEIKYYFDQLFHNSALVLKGNLGETIYQSDYDILQLNTIWLVNYSLFFAVGLSLVNIYKLKNSRLAYLGLGVNVLVILVFLGVGLYAISELRESYISQSLAELYPRGIFNLIIRYISYAFVLALVLVSRLYFKQGLVNEKLLTKGFHVVLHVIVVWVLSSEVLHILDLAGFKNSYKLALSILWGLYALFLISIGIWKNNQVLRIGGMALFGVTLIKLFAYDIIHLGTIAKTIVFVSLGVLLLIISFLYNKFKNSIQDEETI